MWGLSLTLAEGAGLLLSDRAARRRGGWVGVGEVSIVFAYGGMPW
jgi:hypothetical protein